MKTPVMCTKGMYTTCEAWILELEFVATHTLLLWEGLSVRRKPMTDPTIIPKTITITNTTIVSLDAYD